jgi:dTMP kinase
VHDGRFVTLEGGEGSGKSTLLEALAARARASGAEVVTAREPGSTAFGERLRAALLGALPDVRRPDPIAELLTFAAARAQLVAEVVRPALARGALVLLDRYADSTTAYQQYGRGLPAETVTAVNAVATTGLWPDLTVLLDLEPADGLARGGRHDYLEHEALAFHQRVRAGYLALAQAEPARWLVLDATQAPATLADAAWSRLQPLLH